MQSYGPGCISAEFEIKMDIIASRTIILLRSKSPVVMPVSPRRSIRTDAMGSLPA